MSLNIQPDPQEPPSEEIRAGQPLPPRQEEPSGRQRGDFDIKLPTAKESWCPLAVVTFGLPLLLFVAFVTFLRFCDHFWGCFLPSTP
jgi:hypothetical protein